MQDRDFELLTGFLDGELTHRERTAVLRLLHESSEARRMLWKLQQNRQAVKHLPAKSLPADFAANIVAALQQPAAAVLPGPAPSTATLPMRPAARAASSSRLAWAAGILMAVGGAGGLLYYFSSRNAGDNADFAKSPPENPAPTTPNPSPKEKEQPAPFDIRFTELTQKPEQQMQLLVKEFAKLPADRLNDVRAGRLDVYARNGTRAVEEIARQFQLPAVKPSKGKQFFFVENFSARELAKFLVQLAKDDKKTGNLKNMRLQPMSPKDADLICSLLKIDPVQLRKPPERLDDIPVPKDKGPTVKVQPKTAPPPSEGRGIFLTMEGQDPDMIRSFVGERERAQLMPNTCQLLLVVHNI